MVLRQIKKQQKQSKIAKLQSFVLKVLSVIGILGGIIFLIYYSSLNTISTTYSETELYSYVQNEVINNFKTGQEEEPVIDNFVLKNITDHNEFIEVEINYTFNDKEVSSTLEVLYENEEYHLENGIQLNASEVANKETESEETKISGKEVDKDDTKDFLINFYSSLNNETATQFYKGASPLAENTYYDLESINVIDSKKDITNNTIYTIDYNITDSEGNIIYTKTYKYLMVFNYDNKEIEEIKGVQ